MNDNNVLNFQHGPLKGMSIGLIVLVFIAIIIVSKAILVVNAGERVVIFNSFTGVEKKTMGEGMHFLIPGIQTPIRYNVRTQTYTMAADDSDRMRKRDDAPLVSLTSDGQKISMDMSVRYNPIPNDVWKLHQKIGQNYVEKIIKPEVRSVVRSTIAQYPVIQVYSEDRQVIQKRIESELKERLAVNYINLSAVLIRNIRFTDEFAKAIELKQVALQNAERMKYVLQKEKLEKQRKIIEAQGEAQAIREKGQALKQNPLLIQYAYVQKITPGIRTIITDQASIMNFPKELLEK